METETVSLKSISKSELGFSIHVPKDWSEFPPVLSSSPYEVARFAYRDHTNHLCIVFRLPGSPGLDPRVPAEEAQTRHKTQGFGNFALTKKDVGARAGVLLTFDKTVAHGGVWSVREYFVKGGNLVYALALASGDPHADAAIFDAMANQFQVSD